MSWYLAQVVAGNQQKNVAGSQWCSVTVRAESHCQCQVSPSCLGWCPLSLPVSDLECCDFLSLGNTPQSLDRRVTLHLTSAAGSMADYRPWIQRAMTLFFFSFASLFHEEELGPVSLWPLSSFGILRWCQLPWLWYILHLLALRYWWASEQAQSP